MGLDFLFQPSHLLRLIYGMWVTIQIALVSVALFLQDETAKNNVSIIKNIFFIIEIFLSV